MTTYRNMIKVGGYNTNTELVKQVQQVQLHMVKSGDFFYLFKSSRVCFSFLFVTKAPAWQPKTPPLLKVHHGLEKSEPD